MRRLATLTLALAAAAFLAAFSARGQAPGPDGLTLNLLAEDLQTVLRTVEVQFNPTEYKIEKTAPWQSHTNADLDNPKAAWTTGESRSLSMELVFDTYEAGTDVRVWTDALRALVPLPGQKPHPPIVLFQWGEGLHFVGVLDTVRERYTLFLPDGTPVRARVELRATEYQRPR